MANEARANYDPTTIALHWISAALVVVLWIIGQSADWLPRGALRANYWSAHVALGFALAIALLGRIVWRSSRGRRLPAAETGALHVLAEAMHYALYLLLLLVVGLGVANAFVRGYDLFGAISLPQVGDLASRRPLTQWHGLGGQFPAGLRARPRRRRFGASLRHAGRRAAAYVARRTANGFRSDVEKPSEQSRGWH